MQAVEENPKFLELSFVSLPRRILSKRQANRMQVFPIGYNDLPREAPGDDWDAKDDDKKGGQDAG